MFINQKGTIIVSFISFYHSALLHCCNFFVLFCFRYNLLSFVYMLMQNAYPENCVFHRLVHLTLCTCGRKFLLCLLRDSPKLQLVRFEQVQVYHQPKRSRHCNCVSQCHELLYDEPRPCWIEPSSVPECVISSLETLEWVKYEGTEEEKGGSSSIRLEKRKMFKESNFLI